MTKCVFCGKDESSYKGVSLIKNDGTISFFCSGKCRKNALSLKRDRNKLKWTEAYRINLQKAAAKAEKIEQTAAENKAKEGQKTAAKK